MIYIISIVNEFQIVQNSLDVQKAMRVEIEGISGGQIE